jgi:hypothetical protein
VNLTCNDGVTGGQKPGTIITGRDRGEGEVVTHGGGWGGASTTRRREDGERSCGGGGGFG